MQADRSDKYLTPEEVLGAERLKRLGQLPRLIGPLDELTDGAVHIEANTNIVTPLQGARLERSGDITPETPWTYAKLNNGKYLFIDKVPPNLGDPNSFAALVIPPVHMGLISWWLMHAWRFVELAEDCLLSLGRWNINTGAALARTLVEEVGCMLYESRKIASQWSDVKALSAKEAPLAIYESLRPLLAKFRLGNRELAHLAPVEAISVLTYIDKLMKLPGLGGIRNNYDWLTNVIHPAIGSRLVYLGQPMVHFSEAVTEVRLSRRPTSAGGKSCELEFPTAHTIADTLLSITPIGARLLGPCPHVVDTGFVVRRLRAA